MLFSQDIGIDLGTANTLVYVKGKGIVIREPSVVAVNVSAYPQKVEAVGDKAKQMIGRTPGSITAVRPLKDGVIADFDITSDMLKEFIKMAISSSPFSRARVLICIPSGVTEVERKAVHDAARSAGAKLVNLIDEPMAAAIGAGLPVSDAVGSMVVDIGGGTSEVALFLTAILLRRSRQELRAIISTRLLSLTSERSTIFLSAKERQRTLRLKSALLIPMTARAQWTLRQKPA